MDFTERERAILAMAQGDLPDSLSPYADMAAAAGTDEEEVLELLGRLRASGVIRRFGASIRHTETNWKHNAMVAWKATEEEAAQYAPIATRSGNISHVYFRPSPSPAWPYTLYTMIHGRNDSECMNVVEQLRNQWPLRDFAVLRTRKEWKKISMTYF